MNDTKVVAVEFAGVGSIPQFIVKINGKYEYVPGKLGVNPIDSLQEEE